MPPLVWFFRLHGEWLTLVVHDTKWADIFSSSLNLCNADYQRGKALTCEGWDQVDKAFRPECLTQALRALQRQHSVVADSVTVEEGLPLYHLSVTTRGRGIGVGSNYKSRHRAAAAAAVFDGLRQMGPEGDADSLPEELFESPLWRAAFLGAQRVGDLTFENQIVPDLR
jgi:hypothetical protein